MNAAPDTLKAILFDLDGTLIDTATDFVIVLDRLCTEYQVEPVPYAAVHKTVSSGARALVKLAFDIGETDARFVEIHSRLLSLYLDQVAQSRARTYPGISDLLSALDDSSIQWGIVTNKPEKYTTVLLRQLNLRERCATLICPDHVSAPKPDPESLLLACAQLGCTTGQCIYIGDHPRDIEAGLNARMFTIAAGYGYLPETPEIEHWHADVIVQSVDQITHWLTRHNFLTQK